MLNKIKVFTAKTSLKILIFQHGYLLSPGKHFAAALSYYFPGEDMNSLSGLLSLWPYKHKAMILTEEHTRVKNKPTNQKKPAQISSLPRHKTAHKQESKDVISLNRD